MTTAAAAPVAAPAAAPAAPASAQLADFDSMMDSAPTGFETPEPVEAPARGPQPTDPTETPDEGAAPAESETSEDDDGLLGEEPPAAATAIAEAADKWRELENSPELPADFAEKLWTVRPNGREMQVTVEEMGKGYMRLNESTRRSQELDQREERIGQNEQHYQRFFESIKDPNNFIEVFERQLGPDVLDKAMQIRQERAEQDSLLIESAGLAVMRRHNVAHTDPRVREAMIKAKERIARERQLDIDQRKLEVRNRELESRTQETDTNKRVAELQATFRRQLDQLVPTAFKAHRIRDNEKTRSQHLEVLKVLAKQRGANGITRELVLDAAKILRDDLEDARAAKATPGAPAKPQPSASKGAGGGTSQTRGHVASGPKKLADFDDHFGLS